MRTKEVPACEPTKKRWDAALARRVLAGWAPSEVSLAGFARTRGVNVQRLSWWRKRLATETPETATFIPATVSVGGHGARVVVRLPGGVDVEATNTSALPTAWLAALARELLVAP